MTLSIPSPLISAVITFHNEGLLAHKTLLGLDRVRAYTEMHGITVEIVVVLDSADNETTRVVSTSQVLRDSDQIIEVSSHDQGVARNSGVGVARGDYLCLLDGDDYYSENWFVGALETLNSKNGTVVVHPDYVVCFGMSHSIGHILDMDNNPEYPAANYFSVHPWVCSSFAKREVYIANPYHRSDSEQTGFGFEDWHWNLEVIAEGIRHISAPNTALFYRRKSSSVLVNHHNQNVIVRPSKFFDTSEQWFIPEQLESDPSQKQNYNAQKSYLEELIEGKEWLERKWQEGEEQIAQKDKQLDESEKSKIQMNEQLQEQAKLLAQLTGASLKLKKTNAKRSWFL